jgi:transposase
MAKIVGKTKRYPSDPTDEEWARIEPLMPAPARRGRRRRTQMREIFNAIRYLVRSGCGWRMLPVNFRRGRQCTGGFVDYCGGSCSRRSTTWS